MSIPTEDTIAPAYRRGISFSLVAGAIIVAAVCLAALLAPLIAPFDPSAQDLLNGLKPPSAEHIMGTDQLGRDVWSRVLFAARTDLSVGVMAVIAPAILGTTLGLIAGYCGGWVQRIVGYLVDINLSFPFYVIALALVAFLGAGVWAVLVTFALVAWVNYAKVVSAVAAGFVNEPWVAAARSGGLSHGRVITKHMLPNAIPQIVVILVNDIVFVILAVVTLSYLGLGIQPPTPDWGAMISDGQAFLSTRPWLVLFPGAAILVTGIGFSLLADGVADRLRTGQ